MAIGYKVYNSDGLVTLNVTDSLSRIIGIIGAGTSSGSVTIDRDAIGGGNIFWYTHTPTVWDRKTEVIIIDNMIFYNKDQNTTITYGIYA